MYGYKLKVITTNQLSFFFNLDIRRTQANHARTSKVCASLFTFFECTVNEKSSIIYLLYHNMFKKKKLTKQRKLKIKGKN